jgi:hypothetical protein
VTSPGVSVEVPEIDQHLRAERFQMLEDDAALQASHHHVVEGVAVHHEA